MPISKTNASCHDTDLCRALDLAKPLQTRDGRPVTLISVKGRALWPIVGYIGDDAIPVRVWKSNGSYLRSVELSPSDLINVPEPKRSGEVWVNIYPDGTSATWSRREYADNCSGESRIACVRVPWTKGEGLGK